MPAEPRPTPTPAAADSTLGLLNRNQRRMLWVGGLLTTLILLVTTVVIVHSQLTDYLGQRYAEYVMRRTALQSAFAVREGAMRISVKQEEYAWAAGPAPDPILLRRFIQGNGRITLQRTEKFPPALVLSDVHAAKPAAAFANYLRLADEVSYQTGAYTQALSASGYFFSPERDFIGIGPATDAMRAQLQDVSAATTIARFTADVPRDVTSGPQTDLHWLPPATDPLNNSFAVRIIQTASHDDQPFATFVASYPNQVFSQYLSTTDAGEISRLLDSGGRSLLQLQLDAGTRPATELDAAIAAAPAATGARFHQHNGVFIARDVVNATGWQFVQAFNWWAILSDIWPRLAAYAGAMLLAIMFTWAVLIWLDRKVFKPALVRSQRIVESEDLNRTMVATAPFGLVLLAYPAGGVILQNAVMQAYAERPVMDDIPLHQRLLALAPPAGSTVAAESEVIIPLRDGSHSALFASVVRSRYQGQSVVLCNFSDITLRKEVERELEAAHTPANAANAAKSAFLAMMSHEIRTPLNAILGNIELLGRSALPSAERAQLHTISQSSNALLAIINDVLDFSKIESGQMVLESIAFDPRNIALQAAGIFRAVAEDKGLALELSLDEAIAPAYVGDPNRIAQIVYNLLSNAIKFTTHGDVLLEMYLADDTAEDAALIIGVSDTGIGMTQAQLQGLFQTFSQADASISRRYGGTGLGLALCKRLTGLMGGSIRAVSEPGKGSTFIVTLPLPLSPEPAHPAADETRALAIPQGFHVLVVDDLAANRELLRLQLLALGCSSDQVEDGASGLALFAERQHDLIMTDLNMPGMDGYTLARCLRDQQVRVPIIAITAHASETERTRCSDAGIDAVLTKPILLDALVAAFQRLGNHQVSSALQHIAVSIGKGPLPATVHAPLLASLDTAVRAIRSTLAETPALSLSEIGNRLHALRGALAFVHETKAADMCRGMELLLESHPFDIQTFTDHLDRFEALARASLHARAPA